MTEQDVSGEGRMVIRAVLGWANPDTGPESLRLYALDAGPSPRWAKPYARVVEQAIREHGEHGVGTEGDRFLVVRVGNRFLADADFVAVAQRLAGGGPVA